MSNINTCVIFNEILEFLKTNQHTLLDEHYYEILGCISILRNFENISYNTSTHGCHFVICPWSSNLCKDGPDTCACYIIENKLIRIKKLMLLYKRLPIKN